MQLVKRNKMICIVFSYLLLLITMGLNGRGFPALKSIASIEEKHLKPLPHTPIVLFNYTVYRAKFLLNSSLARSYLTVLPTIRMRPKLYCSVGIKEVLKKECGRSLCYIYSRCTSMELFQLQVAPLVLKFGIHQGQTGRKGVSRREEEGNSGRVESQCS
jgi:hypothetical protein